MKSSIVLTLLLLCKISAFADIRPNPIKAKGIVAGYNNSIRMDSERVIVDLYKDSAIVECHFYMKNDSAAQKLTIGFPEMNFHQFRPTREVKYYNFYVSENGEQVRLINLHQADTSSQKEQLPFSQLLNQQYKDQPWLLWNSAFDEGELKTIVVRYSLPFGSIKNRSRYFTYLLNTGSGWKGNIGKAEIVVNLIDITPDLILKTLPENYKINGNNISWIFSDFEPTINDDIEIYYEPSKGYYNQKSKENELTIVANDKVFPNIDQLGFETLNLEGFAKLINVKVNYIESIEVLKNKQVMSNYNAKKGVLLIYTKDYINR